MAGSIRSGIAAAAGGSSSSNGNGGTGGGLSESDVRSLIAQRVSDQAETGNTDTWPDSKIPASIARDSELQQAIQGFITETSIDSKLTDFRTQAQIEALIEALGHIKWRGPYMLNDAVASYVVRDVVYTSDAFYICIRNVASNTGTITAPGTGSDWQTYWVRIAFRDGDPQAFVGAAFDSGILTLSRESGANPVQVTIPAGTPSQSTAQFQFQLIGSAPYDGNAGLWLADESGDGITLPTGAADEMWAIKINDVQYDESIHIFQAGDLGEAIHATDNPARVAGETADDSTASIHLSISRIGATPTAIWFARDADNKLLVGVSRGNLDPMPLVLYRIGTGDEVSPLISEFSVTGMLNVAAGAIEDLVYQYQLRIAQSAHVGGARIVGFAGSEKNPTTVAVLKTVTDFHDETGSVTIPDGVSLANVGDKYTIRLEVYGENQTAGTDFPVSYHDQLITAIAPAALTHFGYIISTETSSDIDFTNDITTRGDVTGQYVVAGIPDDTNEYLIYFAVPASATQPTGFSSLGFDISNSFDAAVDLTVSSVDYKVYLFKTSASFDASYNGSVITVG